MLIQLDKKDLEAVEASLEASLGLSHRTESLKQEIVRLKKYIGSLLKNDNDEPDDKP